MRLAAGELGGSRRSVFIALALKTDWSGLGVLEEYMAVDVAYRADPLLSVISLRSVFARQLTCSRRAKRQKQQSERQAAGR